MSILGPKIWNKLSSNIKTAATISSSFTHRLKKEILTKLQESAISLIFYYYLCIYFFDSLLFFYYIYCVHTSRGP